MQQRVEVSGAIAQYSAIVQPPLCTVELKMDGTDRAPRSYHAFCKKRPASHCLFCVLVLGLIFLSLYIVPLSSPGKRFTHTYNRE